MNLIECLSNVKDPRRLQGQRYSNIAMLLIIIMAVLRNKHCYREIGRFCQLNKNYLIAKFGFKNKRVPSHVSIRTFILSTDFASIQDAFHQWTRGFVCIKDGEWVSIDGKSIRSTVSDYSNEYLYCVRSTRYQNFVSLVSLFGSKCEQILHIENV